MSIDVLKAPSLLSLMLQNKFLDTVQGIKNISASCFLSSRPNENES